MNEAYISFEIAKLLKEKGFDECIFEFYEGDKIKYAHNGEGFKLSELPDIYYPHITHQMAMKWLREVHHLYIQVMLDSWACGGHTGYYVVIQNTTSDFEMMLQDALDDVFYDIYEVACEAALKYVLENLI